MRYVRTFHIQAAHFNSETAYQIAWAVPNGSDKIDIDALMFALRDCHGHNFRIEVACSGRLDKNGFLVDDVDLASVVNEWNNVNLSMHSDFFKERMRATTESMALVLRRKLYALVNGSCDIESVRVFETDDIYAEA